MTIIYYLLKMVMFILYYLYSNITEVISGVLDGVVQPEDLDSEDYPSCENLERINGYLRTIREFLLGYNEERIFPGSLLDFFRNQYQNWLEIILRQIYNSGGFLVPIRW